MTDIDQSTAQRDTGVHQTVWMFTFTGANAEAYTGLLDDGRAALLPFSEVAPGAKTAPGETMCTTMLADAFALPVVSATRPELLAALYAGVVPEVRSGDVVIVAIARDPGVRAKVAVAASVEGVDPVAACVGRGANRVSCVSRLAGGERIDVVPFHPDLETFTANALAPAQVSSVSVHDDVIVATVPAHQMPAAVGGGGRNSHLAGELLGRPVEVVSR